MDMQPDFLSSVIESGSTGGGSPERAYQGRGVGFQILVIGATSALAPAWESP